MKAGAWLQSFQVAKRLVQDRLLGLERVEEGSLRTIVTIDRSLARRFVRRGTTGTAPVSTACMMPNEVSKIEPHEASGLMALSGERTR